MLLRLRLCSFAVAFLAAIGASARADEKDPVREKLVAAKEAYDAEMKQVRKQAEAWFGTREDAAREAGDKKLVDQIKAERKAFEDAAELPSGLPLALKVKRDRASKTLESAYVVAVKEYLKANKDKDAAAVDAEWKELDKGPVNLLARVDPKAHAVLGTWKMIGKGLVGASFDKQARLALPYEPGEEYDIEVKCKHFGGNDCFCLGLMAGASQVLAVVDGWPQGGYLSGFDLVGGKSAADNPTSVKGQVLRRGGRENTVSCSVRSGQITLSVNGKRLAVFKGDFTQLSLQQEYRVPNEKALFLFFGPGASYQVSSIVVTPVKGKGTILK